MKNCIFLKWFLSEVGRMVMLGVVALAVILVTLSVLGVKAVSNPVEKVADEIVEVETGVDLEKVEEKLLKK
jgi:cell division protein YceG involved in septum cleavage